MTTPTAVPVAILLLAAVGGCGSPTPEEPRAPVPGTGSPIEARRLVGARLVHIRPDTPVEWTFTADRFAVEAGEGALPADLVDRLLGDGAPRARIEGAWRLDEGAAELVLTGISSGERKGRERVVLPIRPAGTVRCDLGDRQYNVFEATPPGK